MCVYTAAVASEWIISMKREMPSAWTLFSALPLDMEVMPRRRRSSSRSTCCRAGRSQYMLTMCSWARAEPTLEPYERRMSHPGAERDLTFRVLDTSPGRSSVRAKLWENILRGPLSR